MADNQPSEGDTYRCSTCGMAILVTDDCQSEGDGAFFACCGESMERIGKDA